MYQFLLSIGIVALAVAVFGYIAVTFFERMNLMNNRINIKSSKVTQSLLDDIDMKMFKLGKQQMNIGDELRVILSDKKSLKGTLLGAKKRANEIYLLTDDDQVIGLNVTRINHLRVISRYGRLF